MTYLFDASSIYAIVRAERAELLLGCYTPSLARYELGNILWKERYVRKTMDGVEQRTYLNSVIRALKLMAIIDIEGDEQEVVDIAIKYGLTFYDASYVHLAKRNNAVMVTEDGKLAKKVKSYLQAISASQLF